MYNFTTSKNNIVCIGGNSNENDIIVNNSLPNWIWLHAKDIPSPHAVIQTSHPTKQELIEVSKIIKQKSKLKNTSQKMLVEYCPISNLQKTNTPGLVILKSECKHIKIY
jgi:predicted ribosome quality control (RQC) complex YloA/Tae2 family protein